MTMRRRETLFISDEHSDFVQYIQLLNTNHFSYNLETAEDCDIINEAPDYINTSGEEPQKICTMQKMIMEELLE